MMATGSVHRRFRTVRKALLPTMSAMLAVLMVVAGIPGGIAQAGAATGTITWDTRADFEANVSTTDQPTTRVNASTQRVPGSVTLPGPITAVAAGLSHTVGVKSDGTVVAVGDNTDGQCEVSGWTDIVGVAAGTLHTVGLKSDGTVVAVGDNGFGQCGVSDWTDIVAIAVGSHHTVGLKSDGTVVAVGYNGEGRCDVADWVGITSIAAGSFHTLGLRSDGTVVAVGEDGQGRCDVSDWTDIVALEAGLYHTVGLKSDGTVSAVGWNVSGECDVSGWTDVVAVTAGGSHTVGLKSDGAVVAVGYADNGQCNVSGWGGVTAVAAGESHTVGLRSDGTVVAVGSNTKGQCDVSGWGDFVDVVAGSFHTVGLKSDGTAIAGGWLDKGQCDVSGWSDIVGVTGGYGHTVGLKSDGTVVAAGDDTYGQASVSGWTDITEVAAGYYHTVGLKSDGTVLTVGLGEAPGWSDIVAIAAGVGHTVGLKSDGTVVAVGWSSYDNGQCNVSEWSDIVAVAAGDAHTLGLKSDGTVVAVGRNWDGECNVSGWSDIVALTAGRNFTIGLKSDGTAVAVGWGGNGQCNVTGWSDVVSVSAGVGHTVGLKSDGTVVGVGDGSYGQLGCTSWTSMPLGARLGVIGGADSAAGLRAQAPSGLGGWTKLDAVTSAMRPGEAVKFAVRLSDDGVNWSGPLGHDGQPIDWTNLTGNYLGRARADVASRSDLSELDPSLYIDIIVRLESEGVLSPELRSVALEYQVNDAPLAVADSYTVAEDTVFIRAAPGVLENDSDTEGDTLTAIKMDSPDHGTLALNTNGSFTYTPQANWHGTDSFTYKANDGNSDSGIATVSITVTAVNDAPLAVADSYTIAEDTVLTRAALGVLGNDADADGDPLTAIKVSDPAHGTLALNANGSFTYTPHADWYGTDSFTYRARDGIADSNLATVNITVTPVVDLCAFTVATASRTLPTAGATYTFTGALRSGAKGVPGRRVVLQSAGSAAGPWTNTSVFTHTAADGSFSLQVKPVNKTHYRASFVGDADFVASSSDARSATPRASIGAPVAPKTMKRSKSYTVYGSLKPKHTSGTKPVRIYKYMKVGKKWVKKGYVKATAYSYKGYTRYKVKMKLTTKGSWRLRAYAPADSGHAATWSSKYDYVKVK